MAYERAYGIRCDGSAKWKQDNTIVLAAVMGPRQASQMREDAEGAVVEVNVKSRNNTQGQGCEHASCKRTQTIRQPSTTGCIWTPAEI